MDVASSFAIGAGRLRWLGTLAVVAQLIMVALLFEIMASARSDFPNPPEPVPRSLALGLLFTLPAIIGAVGVVSRDRALLAAGAILASAGSVLAFSGVTLIFLVPALITLFGGVSYAQVGRVFAVTLMTTIAAGSLGALVVQADK